MKVGEFEGTPQEIKDLMENHGLNLGDYLAKTEKPISSIWMCVPSILFSISLLGTNLFLSSSESKAGETTGFLVSMGIGIWLTVVIQIRYKSVWTSIFTITMLALLSLVSIGVMQPHDLMEYLEKLKSE